MIKASHVQGYFRNTKEQKRAITPSRNKHCFKKQLNFWSSDVLNSKMGIILKKKKCEPKDQVSEGDDTTASVLFNELV